MIEQNRACIYVFHAAPGLLWRRERHQNIKDIRSCCFTAKGTTSSFLFPVQPPKAFLPCLYLSQPLPRYLSSASTAISSDGRKPHCTIVETSPEGDKCSAFCPPPPFSAMPVLSTYPCYWPSQSRLPDRLHSLTQRTSWIVNFFSCFLYFHLSFQMDGAPSTHLISLLCSFKSFSAGKASQDPRKTWAQAVPTPTRAESHKT